MGESFNVDESPPFISLVPFSFDPTTWLLFLLKHVSEPNTLILESCSPFFYRSRRLDPKKLSKTSWKSQVQVHSTCHLLGTQLRLRWPWGPPRHLHLTSSFPHLTCLLFADGMEWGDRRGVFWAPTRDCQSGSQENSIYSRLIFTGRGSGQQAGLVQDVKLWEVPDCYHCQIQFPPTASAPPPGPWCPSVYGNGEVLARYF